MDRTEVFQAERPRLVAIASRVLGDPSEAEDVTQQTWLRLHATDAEIESLPAWLTTVTTRLCLDRLRSRIPVPVDVAEPGGVASHHDDPADRAALVATVGAGLHVVLERLSPRERVAFVLHDSFEVDFPTIAAVLETTPVAARQLASRARGKVAGPHPVGRPAGREVVDAFLAAARDGDFDRLLELLAPDATLTADVAAALLGSPRRVDGREQVATFFNGSAKSALPVLVAGRPGAAWFVRGAAKVAFDFTLDLTLDQGLVQAITFRADPEVLATVARRRATRPRD